MPCLFDKVRLVDGERWDDGFVQGLARSTVFVPLISRGATEPMTRIAADAVDNVLLEWNLALRLHEMGAGNTGTRKLGCAQVRTSWR